MVGGYYQLFNEPMGQMAALIGTFVHMQIAGQGTQAAVASLSVASRWKPRPLADLTVFRLADGPPARLAERSK